MRNKVVKAANNAGAGAGLNLNSTQSFFVFIFLFALLSFCFLFFNYTARNTPVIEHDQHDPQRPIHIVLWDVKDDDPHGTFLGSALAKHKDGIIRKSCPRNCTFTTNRADMHLADAVIFDPTALDYDNWRRVPMSMPHKQPYQVWVMASYQHQQNYPLVGQPVYNSFMDLKMTYNQKSDIPISLFCPWGDSFKGVDDLKKPLDMKKKDKDILFISSNCVFSGASARTAYVKELMEHISVDSYGECLNNKEWPFAAKAGSSFNNMDDKISLMSQYKIVLAFENHNLTDYVTEKVFNAFQAGSLPVYMGAPNIDDWLPGKDSVVKTSDFSSPKALAAYLKKLLADEKEYKDYFKWKKGKIASTFEQKYQRCLYSSECRICEEIAKKMPINSGKLKKKIAPERPTDRLQAVRLTGEGGYVQVPHHTRLCVYDKYTLMAWVKPSSFGDQRIIDKNKAGTISGFNFDIQSVGRSTVNQGFLRLCAGEGCYMSKKGISKDVWSHVAVVYSSEHPSVFENHVDFYINGVLDHSEIVFAPTAQERGFPLSFGIPASDVKSRNSFHGSIDNVAIFDQDFTAEQVRKYMFGLPRGDEEHLVGFWAFDEPGDEPYAHDYSRYEFDGQLTNAVREPSPEKPLYLNKCH